VKKKRKQYLRVTVSQLDLLLDMYTLHKNSYMYRGE